MNGKDSGSHFEIIFEVDYRPRTSTPLTSMAGLFNALAVAQTEEGLRGSLVPWPSDRWAEFNKPSFESHGRQHCKLRQRMV